MQFMGLTEAEKKKLEYEVVSDRARLKLTRLLRHATRAGSSTVKGSYSFAGPWPRTR